ncbi:MAG: FGGY-family carbohydrate kinase [Oscillospiraceae bacterium]|nr:FGGY-family carbohydrate kinase [Oscillospiraceae bacterium]
MFLGIELGSTRIKAVVIDTQHKVIDSASYAWENKLVDDLWSYDLDEAWAGMRACVAALNVPLDDIAAMGVSGMMHGYLPFDAAGRQLVPFRTWRNTNAAPAAQQLSELLGFAMPRRWSISHLVQAALNEEAHVPQVDFITTLAGYIHWQLSGEKVLGAGEASGVFPLNAAGDDYHADMLAKCNAQGYVARDLRELLPCVLQAGQSAGKLSESGAARLGLPEGIVLCPPEGDAATGMVATNAVTPHSGNVSAGTSMFAMIVLEQPLPPIKGIDIVATPAGKPVAMVHCNNGTSDIDAWMNVFAQLTGEDKSALYARLYAAALQGEPDCGGVVNVNFVAAEPMLGVADGMPSLSRIRGANFTLPNMMRAMLFSMFAGLSTGLGKLAQEGVQLARITGHGGLFKSHGPQQLMAAALGVPVSVMQSAAGEGGAWGMALLASYVAQKASEESLVNYLEQRVFAQEEILTLQPDDVDRQGFVRFMQNYMANL